MSHSPTEATEISPQHPYAQGASQLNRLVREGRSFSGSERNCCYLNTKGGTFANLSTVSGIDFPDDGRAIAASDWDFDGDIDFWVANRTGPQLRWMRNELQSDNHFVAIRLSGIQSNRDAIGARVRLSLTGDNVPLIKSVRAGEGFLAQGSKWLHFGLGENDSIEKVEIRWPSGSVEQIDNLAADHYYTIAEGEELAQRWMPPAMGTVEIAKAALEANAGSSGTQLLLGRPAPLPPLEFRNSAGQLVDATRSTGKPRLVNIWSITCRPCLAELKEWTDREADLRESGLQVLALSVDALDEKISGGSEAARQTLQRLEFPYQSGEATTNLLDVLQLVNNTIFRDDHRRLPVPTSVLIDGQGRLAAMYKGPVHAERILSDVRLLSTAESERLVNTLPFSGRWLGLPGPHRIANLVDQLWDSGFDREAEVLIDRMPLATTDDQRPTDQKLEALEFAANRLQSAGQPQQTAMRWQQVLDIRPQDGNAHLQLGVLAAKQNQLEQAIKHFQLASQYQTPPTAATHLNLAQAYRQTKQIKQAEQEFRKALDVDPKSALAYSGLGLLQASQTRFSEAVDSFRNASRLDPRNVQHITNLATAYLQLGKPVPALEQLEHALQLDPESLTAQVYAAEALAAMQQPRQAIARLKKAAEQQPKVVQVWHRLSELSMQVGDLSQAVAYLERTHKLAPRDPYIAGNLAWILSTSPDESIRNGKRAVKLATTAVRSTQRQVPQLIDALAAAYAEAGLFEDAEKTATEALNLLRQQAGGELAKAIEDRRLGYQRSEPFRVSNSSQTEAGSSPEQATP